MNTANSISWAREQYSPRAYTHVVDIEVVRQHLNDPDWVLVDCRHDPFDPQAGRLGYESAHIPNALHVDMIRDLSGPVAQGTGRHPLPAAWAFARRLAAWGIDRHVQIVAYDNSGNNYAARFWWMCRWLGLTQVAVLNGGWQAWLQGTGIKSYHLPPLRPPRQFTLMPTSIGEPLDTASVEHAMRAGTVCLIDARPPERYAGKTEPHDPVAGHIPGARNRYYRDNLDSRGLFLSVETLSHAFLSIMGDKPPDQVVHQCGAGINACHNLLAMEYAGLHGSKLYPGSWSAWCADASRPITRSAEYI